MHTPVRTITLLLLAAAFPLLSLSSASACILNNQSSLSANGYTAEKNLGTSSNNPSFVPFVFARVYGRGGSISFSENFADLKKSLSSAALAHAFLWRWGDGTYTVGRAPSHTYRRVGSYVVSIYAYRSAEGGDAWAPFDRATIKIVPPGEVWKDNLGYTALDVLGFVMHWVFWIGATVLLAIIVYGFWEDWKRRHGMPERAKATSESAPVAHP